ncbi:MAG: thermonuclease family protein [Aestuariivirga sp.]|nr:thermonuclease family protein [Aestuariivirga sp.]
MSRYRRSPRPFYRSAIDGLVFLAALTLVLAAMKQFGWIDLGGGALHVVDGDSLRRGDLDIRLHGIDAPEYRQTCRDKHGAEYTCGKHARNALRSLVGAGEVSCSSPETDRYGRAVAVCRIGSLEINGEMVRLGWAIAYARHSLSYVRLEAEARLAKRGIWAGSFEPPADYRARLHLVQGNLGEADLPD